mmetsp:Transcript_71232/g.82865  ORF Transcript_71232/g.82865 Transcript_71232/m.82865 type:complete len:301 (-) Transcript_71232:92-994(-)|eukprot:CAMPEP_0176416786 /NCGR_PEP_ID=MMETSP0127-20121128/6533_1 /TAXON_ID=938130 /ORGANISM="Platyophrya macrostoma, Strain WH" /LENGTH=300 /DNA_ID=CAMNT_0017796887 /DNA_START=82 /DNA_END=984 /DNA_ORIENTATION=-
MDSSDSAAAHQQQQQHTSSTLVSIEVIITLAIGAGLMLLALVMVCGRRRAHAVVSAAAAAAGIKTKKLRDVHATLIGICGSGKTALFLRLIGQKFRETNTSLQSNQHTLAGRSDVLIVDTPGSRRKRGDVLSAVEVSKKLVIVLDSISIQDDRDEGANAVADLICDVFNGPAAITDGLTSVLFACTKRDDLTSFSSKAVRRLLETAIARELATRQAGVGSLGMVAGVKSLQRGNRSASAATSNLEGEASDVGLYLRDDGKFSFDDLSIPFSFVDVSSTCDEGEASSSSYSFAPVRDFILL